jgi:type I restriction enzyme S subunit
LSSFLVPIPPLAEQRRIVDKVDQLMALVNELERQQETSREKASKLLDAIVQEMTSGERGIAATMES